MKISMCLRSRSFLWSWSKVTQISWSSRFSNVFSSETTGPVKVKFHTDSPGDGGTKVYSIDPGHMTKLHIWWKPLKIFFGTDWPIVLKLGLQHLALEYYQVCSNDDPRLTFDLFMQRSALGSFCICMGKCLGGHYKNLSWVWGADRKIRLRVTVWRHKALPSDAKQWSRGMDFFIRTKQPWQILFIAYFLISSVWF